MKCPDCGWTLATKGNATVCGYCNCRKALARAVDEWNQVYWARREKAISAWTLAELLAASGLDRVPEDASQDDLVKAIVVAERLGET